MSIKSSILRTLIKLTPNIFIIWGTNFILKGIAQLVDFNFDIDARTLYAKTQLYGESDTIEVTLQDFAVFNDGDSYRFIIHQGYSDRPWLNNLLGKFIGKAWKIPALPLFTAQLDLAVELFKSQPPALERVD